MIGETVVQMFQPDAAQMRLHIDHLFGDQAEGVIELAWTTPATGSVDKAEIFPLSQIDQLIAKAVEVNSIEGQSVYIGAALRHPGTLPFGRCKDADYFCSPACYVDLDDPAAVDAITSKYEACKPTFAVVTGRQPHKRMQLWWKLDAPLRDPVAHKAAMERLAASLGSDPTVTNPSRVMRLGGSIAWPSVRKQGRVTEMTAALTPQDTRPQVVGFTDLARLWGGEPQKTAKILDFNDAPRQYEAKQGPHRAPISGRLSVDSLLVEIRAGRLWHNNVNALIGHWIMRGWSDTEILATAQSITLSGYTLDQTVAEMRQSIAGGRAKWAKPDPKDEFAGEFDSDTGEFKSSEDDDPGPFAVNTLQGAAPPREWLVQDWLPARTVTALYGDGGMGKTLLAQQLAAAYAIGGIWCGFQMPKGRALCVLCEDDRDEIWRRQDSIDRVNGMGVRAQMGDLFLWPRVGFDSVLENFDRDNLGKTTAFYARLDQQLTEIKPGFLVLDTAADLFGGNEIIRNQVNQFIKAALGKFVVKHELTILLLAHPSMSGMASGAGTGGSTGWNNSVRSRWYLERPEGLLPAQRILTRKKANYASAGDDQVINLVWEGGVLTTQPKADTVDKIELNSLKSAVAAAITKAWNDNAPVGTSRSSRPVKEVLPRLIRDHQPALVMRAFLELERDGYVSNNHSETHKRGYKMLRDVRTGEFLVNE